MPVQPAFLTLNRHKTYYFRIVVPKPLRTAFSLQREIRRSLKTDSARLALKRARQYAARFEAAFDRVLAVAGKDDYLPTDEDFALYLREIELAEHGGWACDQPQPAEKFSSALSDDEWHIVDTQQRWSAVAEVLTGNAKRDIPESQRRLAEQLFEAGKGIPSVRFRKLLPKLLDDQILLHNRLGAAEALPPRAPLAPVAPGPTLFELWEQHREMEQRLNKKKSVSAQKDEHGHACRLNILSGNKPFGLLTLDEINQIYSTIKQIKTVRGMKIPSPTSPIDSILAKPGEERLSGATVEKIMIRLGVLHNFAYRKGLTEIDPLKPEKPAISKKIARTIEEQLAELHPFSKSELNLIFSGYIYSDCQMGAIELVFPYQFWLPLLGIFTGSRLNEICQLDVEDIAQETETGIWFASITDDDEDKPLPKALKNQSSRRFVPLHEELINAGFLDFLNKARDEGREKLFSDGLTYNPTKGWGGNATTFFTRMPSKSTPQGGYFFNLGIRKRLKNGRPDNKKFHSFRHTFIDLLRNTGAEARYLLETFTGHAKKGRSQTDDYGLGIYLKNKHAALHTVKFPAILSGIKYSDFESRLGMTLRMSVERHRQKHGLNQREVIATQ